MMGRILFAVLALSTYSVQGWFLGSDNPEDKCLVSPEPAYKLYVDFLLNTRANPIAAEDLTETYTETTRDLIGRSPYMDFSKPFVFLIHGYTDTASEVWVNSMVATILKYDDVNVVCVNWEKNADSLYYGQSAANTGPIGYIVGTFIWNLNYYYGIPYSAFHLIGHSLGAHVAGSAGASLDGDIGRITGLDPAGPCFRTSLPDARLSSDDAIFVAAIHTDGDHLLQGGFGTEVRMGDADFYPNGGEEQPDCSSSFWDHTWDLFTGDFMDGLTCNHARVRELFEESINPANKFTAYPCSHWDYYKTCKSCGTTGCSRMGYYAATDKKGIFTLETYGQSPFSKG